MRQMAAEGVLFDACVTDPPYHLTNNTGTRSPYPGQYTPIGNPNSPRGGFMGKTWDGGDVAFQPETWRLVFDVLKPGAHLLAFGGTRGYHRLAAAIEDAGFEVRDAIMWHTGQGFPKSHDISKTLDKMAGAEREVVGHVQPHDDGYQRKLSQRPCGIHSGGQKSTGYGLPITAPATDAAKRWQGWGTALKPATEIICVARKPLSERTVAANVLRHGTGALNIDASRIEAAGRPLLIADKKPRNGVCYGDALNGSKAAGSTDIGRWPANVILDDSEEVAAAFAAFVERASGSRSGSFGNGTFSSGTVTRDLVGDTGTAARFFYSAKADKEDRAGSRHPTIKPLDLMRYLVRLITPPGGTVLDPFAGSGTTLQAAWELGMKPTGCEAEAEYQADIRRRMEACQVQRDIFLHGAA
jgi:site-specific DNA-methyltransferase (adenine-specific)